MQRLVPAAPVQSAVKNRTGSLESTLTFLRARLPGAVLTVLAMLFLKIHYSLAGAEELDWILSPTACLVAWFTSANPVFETAVGYVDFSQGIIVAPACAGINFMIMAFGLAAFFGLCRIQRTGNQLAWLMLALAAAYGFTLVVNTMRIAISMALFQADIYTEFITADRVHRLAGVVIYFGALLLYFMCLGPIARLYNGLSDRQRDYSGMRPSAWLAVGLYLTIAVVVPVANRPWRQGLPSFAEHCGTVVIATLALFAAIMIAKRLLRAPYQRVLCRAAALCRNRGTGIHGYKRCLSFLVRPKLGT